MPDESSPSAPDPRRQRLKLSELSRETLEDDLWDLDAEAAAKARKSQSRSSPAELAPGTETPEPPATTTSDTTTPEPATPPEPAAAPPDPEAPGASQTETPVESAATPSPDHLATPEPAAKSPAPRSQAKRREWIVLGSMALVVLIGAVVGWRLLLAGVETERFGEDEPELPIRGQFATVSDLSSYWRPPQRDGERRDYARSGVEFVPVVSVQLSDGSGAIRAIFRTHTGEFLGDAITRAFSGGTFQANGEDTIDFPATDGFEREGDMHHYRIGDERWSVELYEGPGPNASGDQFKRLLTLPISTQRR